MSNVLSQFLRGVLLRIRPQGTLGERGERAAARYLKRKGYKILMCNYDIGDGEIDIVARQGDVLVFVEVKTRESPDGGAPFKRVTGSKQHRLTKAARAYLSHYKNSKPAARFDVISIVMLKGQEPQIEHLQNAFAASF